MLSEGKKRTGLVLLATTLVVACSTALYVPKASPHLSKEDLSEMQKGRAAYISKCGSCHSLILPEKHSSKEWKAEVERMATKAHLSHLEEEQIIKYLSKNDSQ
jgi:DNA-binding transcriptional regulator YhcF (GntR family)